MSDPRTTILVVTAFATLLVPLVFLAALVAAVLRRRAGHEPGPGWSGAIAFLGGASLGTMFLVADDLVVGAPLALVVVGVAIAQWRASRRGLAAQLVLGAALPWTLLWATYMVLFSQGRVDLDPGEAVVAFMAGAVPCALAVLVLLRGQRDVPFAIVDAPPGVDEPIVASPTAAAAAATRSEGTGARRLPRSFHTVGVAMREPSRIGPFGLPEVAALVTLVVSGLAVTSLAMFGLPTPLVYVLTILVTSALATEAYLRAMAPRTRRSMEAFMWLGSWDLGQVRAATGSGVPTTRGAAVDWLARHPEVAGEPPMVGSLRVELSLLAGRATEARALVERLPEATPLERFNKAASADVVAWWTGQGDATATMAEVLPEILPSGGDDRWRADVALAIARVRHLAVANPPVGDPLGPLLEVRDRLGARADGMVRRILWPRLYRVFVLTSILFAVAGIATGISAPPW